ASKTFPELHLLRLPPQYARRRYRSLLNSTFPTPFCILKKLTHRGKRVTYRDRKGKFRWQSNWARRFWRRLVKWIVALMKRLKKGNAVAPVTLRSKNGFALNEDEIRDAAGQVTGRIYFVLSPDGEEVLFESDSRPEAEKAFEHLTD